MDTDRPLRGCELCGQVDTAPRHVVSTPIGEAGVPDAAMVRQLVENGISDEGLAALLDDSTQIRHMDCCAAAGCPAEPGARCGDEERAGSGLQNEDLLAHIQSPGTVKVKSTRVDKTRAIEGAES